MRVIVLVGHGSRLSPANELIATLAAAVASRTSDPVRYGFLELAEPSLDDALSKAAADGATELVLVPCLLAPGRHVLEDIPASARRSLGPAVSWRVAEALGTHPGLVDLVLDRARG
jgi:sirohydrochlorin ferrochelatase